MIYYIGIEDEYTSDDILKYKHIYVSCDNVSIKEFDKGDFIKDWYNCMLFLNSKSHNGFLPVITTTSQLNHLSDYGFDYESGYLHIIENKPKLLFFDRGKENWWLDEYISNGIELFVPDNTWTYNQLVEYSKK